MAKKSPGGLQTGPGHKDGNATIKEKQMNKDTLAHLPKRSVHSRQRGCNRKGLLRMLDHLVHFEPEVTSREGFVKLDDASPEDVLSAQVATEQWLAELGVDDDGFMKKYKPKENNIKKLKLYLQKQQQDAERDRLGSSSK